MHLKHGAVRLVALMLWLALWPAVAAGAVGPDEGRQAYARGEFARAAELLRPDAEKGDVEAQFILGFLHDTGRGVERDPDEALRWYRMAAEAGHARAQYNVGLILLRGRNGVESDPVAAADWYLRAAEREYAPAQYALAELYATGEGVDADPVRAHQWFALAAEQKYEDAKKRRKGLADEMTPREIALAEMHARHWKQRFKGRREPGGRDERQRSDGR